MKFNKEEVFKKFYEKGYLYKVKLYYSNGRHKYANLFKISDYEMGTKIGSIVKYKKMNFFERFIFRNCM